MLEYKILKINDHPDFKETAAKWFHEKWHVPLDAYIESMDECIRTKKPVPQWYIVTDKEKIIAGLGVIENDFHKRKDLSPNVCALYVDKNNRGQGIAGNLLQFVCDDMKQQGIYTLYLVTDHISLYEKFGWKFLCMVQNTTDANESRMYIHQTAL